VPRVCGGSRLDGCAVSGPSPLPDLEKAFVDRGDLAAVRAGAAEDADPFAGAAVVRVPSIVVKTPFSADSTIPTWPRPPPAERTKRAPASRARALDWASAVAIRFAPVFPASFQSFRRRRSAGGGWALRARAAPFPKHQQTKAAHQAYEPAAGFRPT